MKTTYFFLNLEKRFCKKSKTLLLLIGFLFLIILLCSSDAKVKAELSPTVNGTPVLPTVTAINTATPTHEIILLQKPEKHTDSGLMSDIAASLPHLWREIDPEKISIFYSNWVSDSIHAADGSYWVVGGFGVIHIHRNGNMDWYNINTGMPVNFFRSIAISPTGEVWVGGTENSLLHFNGEQWIDESLKLPPPLDPGEDYLCYSKDIVAIDFDRNGNTWVMNEGIEIYTQTNGQWINFPFPKARLPMAGGGGCPLGLRVVSKKDITIKMQGCCGGEPRGMHFNGFMWVNANYAKVDELLETRHSDMSSGIISGPIYPANSTNRIFDQIKYLPISSFGLDEHLSIMADHQGTIWITDGVNTSNNSSGEFYQFTSNTKGDPDITDSLVLDFVDEILFYQEGKRTYRLPWFTGDTSLGRYEIGSPTGAYPTVDAQDRIWLYFPDHGLALLDHGDVQVIDQINELNSSNRGGILPFDNDRILIGSIGSIWMLDNSKWKNFIIPDSDELLTFLKTDGNGNIYAASDTGVYQLQIDSSGNILLIDHFPVLMQDQKPWIVTEDSTMTIGRCTYTEYYAVFSNCYNYQFDTTPTVHYDVKLMHIQEDGSIIFITNHTIGQLKDGKWKTYLFDTIDIQSAAVDQEGAIWIYTGLNGLLRLAPDVFDSFQDFVLN